jgi:DNA-binding HxlR family transcriptional regulator
MPLNIENEFKELRNQHTILKYLKSRGSSRFTESLRETRFSSRTLSKHLKSLCSRGLIAKLGARYEVTGMGLEFLGSLKDQLAKFDQYRKIRSARSLTRDYAVEVTTIGPFGSHHCLGIFHITRPRVLELQERQQMDRALTKVMHTITASIPKGSREFGVRITGTLK